MKLSIVLTAYEKDYHDLRKMVQCLYAQTDKDFEVLSVFRNVPDNVPDWVAGFDGGVSTTGDRVAPYLGNAERAVGLSMASGDAVCWVNADNVVLPTFVAKHKENFATGVDISLVNTYYWTKQGYYGIFPRSLSIRNVDLLNFALKTELARGVHAFSKDLTCVESDWAVLSRAMQKGSYHWDVTQEPCAAHF